jgi:hypothetical protein
VASPEPGDPPGLGQLRPAQRESGHLRVVAQVEVEAPRDDLRVDPSPVDDVGEIEPVDDLDPHRGCGDLTDRRVSAGAGVRDGIHGVGEATGHPPLDEGQERARRIATAVDPTSTVDLQACREIDE